MINKGNSKMNVNEMTIGEVFGYCMSARRITSNSTTLEVIQALVDTTRQASEEVAGYAAEILYDFLDYGNSRYQEYMECLTETPGEYVSNRTGEVVSVQMIP